jgi:hypothetical protein
MGVDQNKLSNNILLTCILIVAAWLRLYHLSYASYDYDEITTLFRLQYPTLGEAINKGVMLNDVHPAGMAVFLYYWTKIFDESPFATKLPFVLFGVASVYYTYKIGKDWFNPTVGLVCALFIATLQDTIHHSQEIRQYSSGLFFCLAIVYYWSKVIFHPETRFKLNISLYILFSALCAYDHYFSLFFAGIVGITGLFFIGRTHILYYIGAGIAICILFIPHVHILLYQFKTNSGGVEWIGKPKSDFIVEYLKYIFHFSTYIYVTVSFLFIGGVISYFLARKTPDKFYFISWLWFLVPFLVAYFYSIYVNPVLEPRVLYFSLPFLLFALVGLLPDSSIKPKATLLTVICILNVTTLVYGRKYYQFAYREPIHEIYRLTDSVSRKMGNDNIVRFTDCRENKKIARYYIKQDQMDSSFILLDSTWNKIELINYLEKHPKKYLSWGGVSSADILNIPIFLNYYPNLAKEYDFFDGTFYTLSSEATGQSLNTFHVKQDYEKFTEKGWSIDSVGSSGKYSLCMDSGNEYSPEITLSLKDAGVSKNGLITVEAEIYPLAQSMSDVVVVAVIEPKGKTIEWTGTPVTTFIPSGTKQKWVKVYHAIRLSTDDLQYPDAKLKVYIWNKGRKEFLLDDFEVNALKGNPYLYILQSE